MTDYTISLRTEPTWTAYAIETRDGRKSEQIVRFAPGLNTPENVLSVALSDLLVRIERGKKQSGEFSVSVPWYIGDDIVFEKVCMFGEVELRMK